MVLDGVLSDLQRTFCSRMGRGSCREDDPLLKPFYASHSHSSLS